jgi:hypothetical protein
MKVNANNAFCRSEVIMLAPKIVFKPKYIRVRPQSYFSNTVRMEIKLVLMKVIKMFYDSGCSSRLVSDTIIVKEIRAKHTKRV